MSENKLRHTQTKLHCYVVQSLSMICQSELLPDVLKEKVEGVAVLAIHINPCAFSRELSLEAVFLYQEVTVHPHTSLWHSDWRVTVLLHDIRTRPKNSVDPKRMDLWIVLE